MCLLILLFIPNSASWIIIFRRLLTLRKVIFFVEFIIQAIELLCWVVTFHEKFVILKVGIKAPNARLEADKVFVLCEVSEFKIQRVVCADKGRGRTNDDIF